MEPEPNEFAVIPYIKGTSEVIKRALAKHNVKTALKPSFSYYRNQKQKFDTQEIKRSNILYSILRFQKDLYRANKTTVKDTVK